MFPLFIKVLLKEALKAGGGEMKNFLYNGERALPAHNCITR